jgi:anthranilate phosphoribosyltransferase
MEMKTAIARVVAGQHLGREDMRAIMRAIMGGAATPAQIGGFLVALRIKGETVEEIAAAAEVMRELAARVAVEDDHLVDTCGTGGDEARTFNISTAAAFVAAAAGAKVAKHGNRSVSSSSGSADVLEAAGVKIDLTPDQVAACIRATGVGFMFAPLHHQAMRHAIGPRRELGLRTIFNLLGPLTNPAGARRQVIGVFSDFWLQPLAEVLGLLGSRHVLVVHAADGLDEISVSAETTVAELRDGRIDSYRIGPEEFGIVRSARAALVANNAQDSLRLLRAALAGEPGPARDIVQLNAGAAIYAGGLVPDLRTGVARAGETIGSGAALAKLDELARFSRSFQ